MDKSERSKSSGTAWIGGQQKPFYKPRKIHKGKYKGQLEVEYLAKAGVYRRIKIDANKVIDLAVDAHGLAQQMSFEDFMGEKQ